MSRSDADLKERGKMWFAFLSTEWWAELKEYFETREKELREDVCDLTIAGSYEDAKRTAHTLGGILEVKNYILEASRVLKEQ